MSNARSPHRITLAEVVPQGEWVQKAAASTADGTQRKVLEVQVGGTSWRVRRRYFTDGLDAWTTVCEGTAEVCVGAYNRLS